MPKGFKLSARSLSRLDGVHPDLVKVVKRAIELSDIDFMVTEGVRSKDRQQQLVAAGASQTTRSRHLPTANKCGVSCAVDLAAMVGNEVRWDWPLYATLAKAMKAAAKELAVPIEWGGDWKSLKDGPHFQLSWSTHP
jgi:peptidoglycan L-alanyl-D-glutamate endopeptidase CwlK